MVSRACIISGPDYRHSGSDKHRFRRFAYQSGEDTTSHRPNHVHGRLLPYDFKFTSFNEYLLVGKKLKFNRIEILPQISFGRADEVGDTDNYGAAIRDHYWHLGFSLRIRRHGKKLWPGIIFQLQRGIHDVHAGDFRSSLKVKTALVITI